MQPVDYTDSKHPRLQTGYLTRVGLASSDYLSDPLVDFYFRGGYIDYARPFCTRKFARKSWCTGPNTLLR